VAKVYITEYAKGAKEFADDTSIAAAHEGGSVAGGVTDQTPITTTGASAQSAVFALTTHLVRIHTDGIISIQFGVNPTATVDIKRLAANATEYFGVVPGHTLAVITNT